ncbi:AraC family transcriptional regulator [Opitutaceae bacterium TAV5]|nr:AraC family transcriptional regulator [Opitutaceae bacterium TAV5]
MGRLPGAGRRRRRWRPVLCRRQGGRRVAGDFCVMASFLVSSPWLVPVPAAPRSSVLFQRVEQVEAARVAERHRHDFWQLEWARSGEWALETDAGEMRLKAGALVLFPPGTWHAFRYPGRGESFLSVKFHVENAPALPARMLPVPPGRFYRAWRGCLGALLAEEPAPRNRYVLAGLLDSLLARLLAWDTREERLPGCVRRALEHIGANAGRSLTVAETARVAGVAPGYLAGVFREATGLTVKQAIDRQRMELARSLLRYSECSVSQIADQLGFGDVFTFSRFFKKHEGLSPRRFLTWAE